MESAVGSLDVFDYVTFAALIVLAIAFFSLMVFILGLPGKIAVRRNHPHAEAVKLMGWVGFLAIVPWVHALIWAYHDGVTVDIRTPKVGGVPPAEPLPTEDKPERPSQTDGKQALGEA